MPDIDEGRAIGPAKLAVDYLTPHTAMAVPRQFRG